MIGFGGKLGPDQPANHAFAVNFQEHNPEVDGMAGVLEVGTSRSDGMYMPYISGCVPEGTRSVEWRTADGGGGRVLGAVGKRGLATCLSACVHEGTCVLVFGALWVKNFGRYSPWPACLCARVHRGLAS